MLLALKASFLFLFVLQLNEFSLADSQQDDLFKQYAIYSNHIDQLKEQDLNNDKDKWLKFLNESDELGLNFNNRNIRAAKIATLEYLDNQGGKFEKLSKALSELTLLPMTFTRPIDEASSERNAAFDRGKRSIFIDLKKFSRTEWLKAFIHEGIHRLDGELDKSISIFSDRKTKEFIKSKGKKDTPLSELSYFERRKLDKWLIAGLNRGFLAEYRAWLLTFVLYKEARKSRSIGVNEWLENLMQNQDPEIDDDIYIYRALSSHWTDPKSGLFKYEFVKEALSKLRSKLYENPKLVELGFIGEILEE